MEHQPKHILRRSIAIYIDYFLAAAIAISVYIPLMQAFPERFALLAGPLPHRECGVQTKLSTELVEEIRNKLPSNSDDTKALICKNYPLYIKQIAGSSIATIYHAKHTETGTTESFHIILDADGKPVDASENSQYLIIIIFILGSAAFLKITAGRTPGKFIMGLRVQEKSTCSFTTFLKRETLKVSVLIIYLLTGTCISLLFGIPSGAANLSVITLDMSMTSWAAKSMTDLLGFALVFFWYILPLIRWQGQMPYDRLTGFKVIKD